MTIDNSDYGGFVVSKNVLAGKQIHYTFREKSSIAALNGWTVYSVADDDKYVNEADNFQVVSASTLFKLAPVMLELFNAPYGTDLCWLYEQRGPYRFLWFEKWTWKEYWRDLIEILLKALEKSKGTNTNLVIKSLSSESLIYTWEL